jgi:hypothetical protein
MTSIHIDTGIFDAPSYNFSKADTILTAATDAAGAGATQAAIDAWTAHYVLADLAAPKRAATVRGHLGTLWPLIAPLAHRAPDLFDRILSEAVEKIAAAD